MGRSKGATTKATRRRRCVQHDRACLWAGGDGTMERHVNEALAALGSDSSVSESVLDPSCRQATDEDRRYQVGIFVPPPSAEDTTARLRSTLFTILREGEKADALGIPNTRLGEACLTVSMLEGMDCQRAGVDVEAVFAAVDAEWEAGKRS